MGDSTPPPDGRQAPPRPDAPDTGETDLQAWWTSWNFGDALKSLKSRLSPPPPPTPPPPTTADLKDLKADIQDVLRGLKVDEILARHPGISREEETALLNRMDHVLDRAEFCIKVLAELESGLIKESDRSTSGRPDTTRKILTWLKLLEFLQAVADSAKEVAKLEEVNKHIDNFSSSLKDFIVTEIVRGAVSRDFGVSLFMRIDELNEKCKLAIQSSPRCFSLPGILARLAAPDSIGSLFGNLTMWGFTMQEIVTMSECLVDNIGTTPGHMSSIGKEAMSILGDDSCLDKMKLNSDPLQKMTFAIGYEDAGGGFTVQKVMAKLKEDNVSLFLSAKYALGADDLVQNADNANLAVPHANADNAAVQNIENANPVNGDALEDIANDVFSVKFAMDQVYWDNLKCVLQCPFPSLHAKIQMKATHPYYAYAIGLHSRRKIDLSVLFGIKAACLGFQYSYDYPRADGRFGIAMRATTSLESYSFTFKEPGTFKGTMYKKFVNSTTTAAAMVGYSPVDGEEKGLQLSFGLKHALDPSSYLKARAGTKGFGIGWKKSFMSGKCTLNFATHVDINDLWRRPRFGMFFSYRS